MIEQLERRCLLAAPQVLPPPSPVPYDGTPDGHFHMQTGPNRLIFGFSEDVNVAAGALHLTNLTTGQPFTQFTMTGTGASRTFSFTSSGTHNEPNTAPRGTYEFALKTTFVTSVSTGEQLDGNGDGVGGDDYLSSFSFQPGDLDHNRSVNIDDYGRIDSSISQNPQPQGYSNGDANYDGKINIDDYGILDGSIGSSPLAELISSIPSTAQINIDWPHSQNPSVANYNVYRGTTAGFTPSLDNLVALEQPTSNFVDIDGEAGTTYHYKISEIATDGTELGITRSGSARTLATDTVAPAAPTGLIAVPANDTEIVLHWNDESSNETEFTIEQLDNSTWVNVGMVEANGQAYTVRNLAPETNYSFRVAATNTAGMSSASAPTTQSTQPSEFDYYIILVGGHFQTQADLDAGVGVGAIANLLRQNQQLNLSVHVYAEHVTQRQHDRGIQPPILTGGQGQAYTDWQQAFNAGVRRWAIVGYSHGGGIAYQFAERIDDENPVVNPARLGFSGYIDAIQRTNPNDWAPALWPAEVRRPEGSLYHLNIYQRSNLLMAGNGMGSQADENRRRNNADDGGPIGHSNIDDQPTSVRQYMADELIDQLQQMT